MWYYFNDFPLCWDCFFGNDRETRGLGMAISMYESFCLAYIYPDPQTRGPCAPAAAIYVCMCVCLCIYAQFSRQFGHLFHAAAAISV